MRAAAKPLDAWSPPVVHRDRLRLRVALGHQLPRADRHGPRALPLDKHRHAADARDISQGLRIPSSAVATEGRERERRRADGEDEKRSRRWRLAGASGGLPEVARTEGIARISP